MGCPGTNRVKVTANCPSQTATAWALGGGGGGVPVVQVKGHLPTCLLPALSPAPNPNLTHTHLPLRHPLGQERHSFPRTRCEALLTTGCWGGEGTGSSERHPTPHPAPTGRGLLGCKGPPVVLLDQAQEDPRSSLTTDTQVRPGPLTALFPLGTCSCVSPAQQPRQGGGRGRGQRAAPGQTNPDFPASLGPWGVLPTATWRPQAPAAQLSIGVIANARPCPAAHASRASP